MVQFLPTAPADLTNAFDTFDTKKLSDQGAIDLFKKALLHIDEIAFVDKDKFIAGVREKAKNNPELQKLAIKIILETGSSGSTERLQIEEKLDALPDRNDFLERYGEVSKLFPFADDSFYLKICSSNVDVNNIMNTLKLIHYHDYGGPVKTLHIIHDALINIPNSKFSEFLTLIETVSDWNRIKVLGIISKLSPQEGEAALSLDHTALEHLSTAPALAYQLFFNNACIIISAAEEHTDQQALLAKLFSNMTYNLTSAKVKFGEAERQLLSQTVGRESKIELLKSLIGIPDNTRENAMKLGQALWKESGHDDSALPAFITAIASVKADRQAELAKTITPFISKLPLTSSSLINIFYVVDKCPSDKKEHLLQAIALAEEKGFDLQPDLFEALVKLPMEDLDKILNHIKKISKDSTTRNLLVSVVSTAKNPTEIVDTLNEFKRLLRLHEYTHVPYNLENTLAILLSLPSHNRASAVTASTQNNVGKSLEERLLVLGCFSEASLEKLDNIDELANTLSVNSDLKEEFIKNMQTIIKNATRSFLLKDFLDAHHLWQPTFIENFIKNDFTLANNLINIGYDDEIVNYLRSNEGLDKLVKHFNSYGNLKGLLKKYFSPQEYAAIEYASQYVGISKIQTIANPRILDYLQNKALFKSPNIVAKPKNTYNEPLSEESKRAAQEVLKSRPPLSKKNWKELRFSGEMKDPTKSFAELMEAVKSRAIIDSEIGNQGREVEIQGTKIELSAEEVSVVEFYTLEGYLLINGVLDNDSVSLDQWVKLNFNKTLTDLDDVEKKEFEAALSALDQVVEILASALNKIPPYTEPIYRGDAIPSSELEKWHKGKIISASKFLSCSPLPYVCEYFAKTNAVDYMKSTKEEYTPVIYVIDSKSSRNVSSLSLNPHEDERLYLPNQCLQVQEVDLDTQPGLAIMYLKEIDLE